MMAELSAKLGFHHEKSTPYYSQANGQVEAINKVLKTMLCQMVGDHKSNWHLVIFFALWAYRASVKKSTGFTPFQLVYGLEAILPIQCEILSLQLAVELLPDTSVEGEIFLYLNNLEKTRRDAALANEAHKKCIKVQYDKSIQPHAFNEGDLVLTYDQRYDKLGKVKFESMYYKPFVISKVLEKRAQELIDYDGIPLGQPRNGLYLKRYNAYISLGQYIVYMYIT